MSLPNVFDSQITSQIINRLDQLKSDTQPKWGKMNVSQMLAHANVTYDLAYGRIKDEKSFIMKFILKTFIKKIVTNEIPYKPNSRTAPVFLISDSRDFEKEKAKLINNLKDTQSKGANYFEGRESSSFGKMSSVEWNNLFYKHLDHHFKQFGV